MGARSDRRVVRAGRVAVATLLGLAVAACGGGTAPQLAATEPMAIATDIDAALLEPLEGLGPCGDPPEAVSDPSAVPGLLLPDGALLTSISEDGPLTQVQGWVPLTPIGVRADYVTRDDLEVISVEDEVWESETLATDGDHRLFVKAQGICRTASIFVAIVTPEDGSAPQPLGQQQ